jgi:PAS domain S-box-containing protein
MQTFLKKFSVLAGFAILVLMLVANAFITRRQLEVQVGNEAWVAHTRQILSELEETQSLLVDAETGQRGYLLTGKEMYLAPYNRAASQIDGHIETLAQLIAASPSGPANIAQLRSLAHVKLDELAHTIALYKAGNTDQAKEEVLSDRGLIVMDNIRLVLASMRNEETGIEATRLTQYRRSIQITRNSIDLATLVAVLGLMVLAWFILKERELRDGHTQEIRTREEWFRVTLTSIGDAVIATDRNGKVTFFNPVAEAITGISSRDAQGKDILTVFPIFNEISGKPAENPVSKVMSMGCVVGLANHTVLQHVDGHLVPIEDSAAPIRDDRHQLIGVVLVFRDVTAEHKAQEVLRQTEKLAAAARLSASVAHEINNPLEAVVNLIYIAKNDPGVPPAIVQHLSLAEQELERVAHITHQTLGFYRESNAPGEIHIEALIESVLKMYANKLRTSRIEVQRNLSDCPPIQGVAGELKQVFSNMIANAIDAVGVDGAIVISAQFVSADDNGTVEVTIADSGSGIAAEHVDRIFEPFFTTKKDVGTGLGLWVTKEIVERHGGNIHVRPSCGHEGLDGAAFILQLPCASVPQTGEPASQSN